MNMNFPWDSILFTTLFFYSLFIFSFPFNLSAINIQSYKQHIEIASNYIKSKKRCKEIYSIIKSANNVNGKREEENLKEEGKKAQIWRKRKGTCEAY